MTNDPDLHRRALETIHNSQYVSLVPVPKRELTYDDFRNQIFRLIDTLSLTDGFTGCSIRYDHEKRLAGQEWIFYGAFFSNEITANKFMLAVEEHPAIPFEIANFPRSLYKVIRKL